MKSYLTLLLLSLFLLSNAQDKSVFDKLHSTKIDKAIYLSYDGKNFFYSKNSAKIEQDFYKIEKGATKQFQIGNDNDNTIKLFLEFYNPLKTDISLKSSEIDDPNYTAIAEFMAKLPADIPTLSPVGTQSSAAVLTVSSVSNYKELTKVEKNEVEGKIKVINDKIKEFNSESPILFDWVQMFKSNLDKSKLLENLYLKTFDEITTTIKGIGDVETYLFSELFFRLSVDKSNKKTVNNWIKYCHSILYKSEMNNYDSFNKNLKISQDIEKKLLEERKKANSKLKKIKELLIEDYLTIESFLDKKDLDKNNIFKNLTSSKQVLIEAIISQKMEKHSDAIDKLSLLNKKLQKFSDEFDNNKYPRGYNMIKEDSFNWEFEKVRQYELTAISKSENGTTIEDSKNNTNLKVYKSQGRLGVFVSAGIFYTPLEYKNFGISDGLVTETQGDPVYFKLLPI
ncbi:hypothetical protein UMM65_02295 [Aureibaculum sp. 2210JD6-5]|uniref:hypothetical protein n=1 Tax=Aureibaculum sp. 2210JD6-5 TaxID=3103957 RepID=UPI002AAC902B|nr:hypothetical protein [Aureibaculum sp. 2210JD6-5]MDY7394056.1 hypothetical protein [Aureibaculum sp. 2210JD6-5]